MNVNGKNQANSNYFQLDADYRRILDGNDSNNINDSSKETNRTNILRKRLSSMNIIQGIEKNNIENCSMIDGFINDDEISIDLCCEHLGKKLGFQRGSINNQKEHLILLLINARTRYEINNNYNKNINNFSHVIKFHTKLFENYSQWAVFLETEPRAYTTNANNSNSNISKIHPIYMEMTLYFLIWGEAANLRHMPECVCFLYHQLLGNLNNDIHNNIRMENSFLVEIVRPLWNECSGMQLKTKHGSILEHTKIRNYDDINEFFWKKSCLYFTPYNVSQELTKRKNIKTFYEHRSIFTFILNYYRIFQFNIMFFVVLIVLSFLVSISPSGAKYGFKQFSTLMSVVTPFEETDVKMAIASVVMCQAFLSFFKCILELFQGWFIIFSSSTLTKLNQNMPSEALFNPNSINYNIALLLRFLWNGVFSGIFVLMIFLPSKIKLTGEQSLIDHYVIISLVYILPGLSIMLTLAFSPSIIMKSIGSKFIREGASCYIGRNMTPSFSNIIQYIIFWMMLLTVKALVSYFLLISPLMLPSLSIYSMQLTYSSKIVSFHNLGLIVSLWLPVFFVFMYDTQIYFTIFQALVGAFKGLRMKAGEFHGINQISKSFRIAPQLFDQKIVTKSARLNDSMAANNQFVNNNALENGKDYEKISLFQSQMMLRFVVIWNEIVNSFREGDLVDDKEAAILQYDIQGTGEVFEPVFLSAGKIGETITNIIKLAKNSGNNIKNDKKSDSELRIFLVQNDCTSAIKSFYNAIITVFEILFSSDDAEVIDGLHAMAEIASHGRFMRSFDITKIVHLRTMATEFLEAILDLPDPDIPSGNNTLNNGKIMVHSIGVVRNFITKTENLFNALQLFTNDNKFHISNISFLNGKNSYSNAVTGLLNLFHSDAGMGSATRAYLLSSLEKNDAMPRCAEAQRRLGFFMKSLFMDIPQVTSIKSMHSFSVVTPFYSETVMFSMEELNNPLDNQPIFRKAEENGKNITILKYLITCHPEEWENFLERINVSSVEEALAKYPQDLRLWASYRGQTLARTVQGMMLYEDAIKILHWLEIGSNNSLSPEEKQSILEDIVRLKFSYICACQVYGKHKKEGKQQASDIDFLLQNYRNLRVAYIDTLEISDINGQKSKKFDTVLIKSDKNEIKEVYRFELPGDPILGEGKPENQNNAIPFTRGDFIQTIDMNQQHYFEECLKMGQLLETADLHPSKRPVSIIGMREHIFTGKASSLAKFKTWQELVFVTLSQRVLAEPLCVRMHYGHPDVFDKVLTITRGGVSKASKGINLSEDVFAGFNSVLRGGIGTHVEFMQCGKGRDVALSQISMFEAKLANGSGETSLCREAHRMGTFMDFFRLNSMFYSHTGFYFATWLTIVTTFVYMYCKVYMALSGVEAEIVYNINDTVFISSNRDYGFDMAVFYDLASVFNTQYIIQAGLFLTMPLIAVYFTEMGLIRGLGRFLEMIATCGPAFFVFQVGTTMHYFDNNLLHGGAKYQATGRGFKITRESFVLLYKAYCHSHYKKAFELIGLCLIYLAFGDFKICKRNTNNKFGDRYCDTAQSYRFQTFAIWFIAILWLVSPFLFNTDGLDWEKTKVDIITWTKWMFMNKTDKDEDDDKTNDGGWISWWTSDLENLLHTKVASRATVILRESRHFLLLWYIVTLEFSVPYVLMLLGFIGASLVLFYFVGVIGICVNSFSIRSTTRAIIYVLTFLLLLAGYFVVSTKIGKYEMSQCLSLLFGYFAGLYGLSEIFRVLNFSYFQISKTKVVQQVAFFFDFLYGFCLLVPLFILSGIPFMNVIQTRMMYNEGFSKVMSASSQYAFSLAAYIGLLGGTACGWLISILGSLDASADFLSYVSTYDLNIQAGEGATTYFVLYASAGGVFIAMLLNHFLGRRLSISLGGIIALMAMVILSAVPKIITGSSTSIGSTAVYAGIASLSSSIGILIYSIWLYIYEISTKEHKTKTMLLLCMGIVVGMFAAAYASSSNSSLSWVWQIFWSCIFLSFLTPTINMFPESPSWTLFKKGKNAALANLTILRRKQDVNDELNELCELNPTTDNKINFCSSSILIKLLLSMVLQIIIGFSMTPMNIYTQTKFEDDSLLLANCIVVELVGLILSFFYVDRVNHRTCLMTVFLPILLFSSVLGLNEMLTIFNQDIYIKLLLYFIYLFQGIGIYSIIWLTVLRMSNGYTIRSLLTGLSFIGFFLSPIFSLNIRVSSTNKLYFVLYGYSIFILFSILLVLFFFTARTSDGTICTKEEKIYEDEQIKRKREMSNRSGLRTPGSARNRNLSRSRAKSGSQYHLFESPGAAASRRNQGFH